MKKVLYGTTALVAAGLLSGGAQAADPIKISVGGYFSTFAAYSDADDGVGQPAANTRNHLFNQESEIIFSGITTLDNGIKVGVNIQLEGETSLDQIDETYIWFEGSFGKIQIGQEDDAAFLLKSGGPKPTNFFFGVASPVFSVVNCGGNALAAGAACYIGAYSMPMTGDSQKITYFTPRIGGFQFGFSYTPDNSEISNSAGLAGGLGTYSGLTLDNTASQQSEVMSIGAAWRGAFSGVNINVGAGYQTGDLEAQPVPAAPTLKDRDAWGFGGTLSWGAFAVGGSYRHDDRGIIARNSERTDWVLSGTYSMGPWKFGIEYANSEVENGVAGGSDDGEGWALGANYNMGAGVSLQAELQFWDIDDAANASNSENDATVFLVGTTLFF